MLTRKRLLKGVERAGADVAIDDADRKKRQLGLANTWRHMADRSIRSFCRPFSLARNGRAVRHFLVTAPFIRREPAFLCPGGDCRRAPLPLPFEPGNRTGQPEKARL